MNYYLLRQAPNKNTIIASFESEDWDVTMILKSNSSRVVPNILYHDRHNRMFYNHEVMECDYDLLDAFGVLHAVRKELWVVVPQEIFTFIWHSTITREPMASRDKTRTGIFIHTTHSAGSSGRQLCECMG